MKEYLIIDLLESVISGEWGNEPSGEQDVFVLRTTNFSNNGKIDFSKEVVKRNIDEKKVDSKKLNYGDIIIEKSGGSIDQPVGRVVFYDLRDNTTAYLCNNFTSVLRPNTKLVNPKFLFYFLFYLYKCKAVLKFQNQTTGIINLKLDNYLRNSTISIPMVGKQEHIVKILDKAQSLIDKRKQAIAKLDELVQAVFLDMFGDPVKNPYKFEVVQMESLLDFLTSGSRGWAQHFASSGDLFITIKNVKNGKLWLDDVIYVKAPNTKEAERTRVKNKDLLLSITADLGRTAVVDEYTAEKGAYINQHLSILRLNHRCNPFYVAHYLESAGGKIQFASLDQVGVKSGLNFNAIKSLNVILPPIDEQNRFEAVLKKIEKEKEKQSQSLQQLESNFQALLQKAFKGELTVKDGVTV